MINFKDKSIEELNSIIMNSVTELMARADSLVNFENRIRELNSPQYKATMSRVVHMMRDPASYEGIFGKKDDQETKT